MSSRTEYTERSIAQHDEEYSVEEQSERKQLNYTPPEDGRHDTTLDMRLRFADQLENLVDRSIRDRTDDARLAAYSAEELENAVDNTRGILDGSVSFRDLDARDRRAVNDVLAAGFNSDAIDSYDHKMVDNLKYNVAMSIMDDIYPKEDSRYAGYDDRATLAVEQVRDWNMSLFNDAAGFENVQRWNPRTAEADPAAMDRAVDIALHHSEREIWNRELNFDSIRDLPSAGGQWGLQREGINSVVEHAAARLNDAVDAISDPETYNQKFHLATRVMSDAREAAHGAIISGDRDGYNNIMGNLADPNLVERLVGDALPAVTSQLDAQKAISFLQQGMMEGVTEARTEGGTEAKTEASTDHPLDEYHRNAQGVLDHVNRFKESVTENTEFRAGVEFISNMMQNELQRLNHVVEMANEIFINAMTDHDHAQNVSREGYKAVHNLDTLARAASSYIPRQALRAIP